MNDDRNTFYMFFSFSKKKTRRSFEENYNKSICKRHLGRFRLERTGNTIFHTEKYTKNVSPHTDYISSIKPNELILVQYQRQDKNKLKKYVLIDTSNGIMLDKSSNQDTNFKFMSITDFGNSQYCYSKYPNSDQALEIIIAKNTIHIKREGVINNRFEKIELPSNLKITKPIISPLRDHLYFIDKETKTLYNIPISNTSLKNEVKEVATEVVDYRFTYSGMLYIIKSDMSTSNKLYTPIQQAYRYYNRHPNKPYKETILEYARLDKLQKLKVSLSKKRFSTKSTTTINLSHSSNKRISGEYAIIRPLSYYLTVISSFHSNAEASNDPQNTVYFIITQEKLLIHHPKKEIFPPSQYDYKTDCFLIIHNSIEIPHDRHTTAVHNMKMTERQHVYNIVYCIEQYYMHVLYRLYHNDVIGYIQYNMSIDKQQAGVIYDMHIHNDSHILVYGYNTMCVFIIFM